jgi:hypothetical protein
MNDGIFYINDVIAKTIEAVTDRKLKGKALKEEIERARTVISGAEASVKFGMLVAALYRISDNSRGDVKLIRKLLGQNEGGNSH